MRVDITVRMERTQIVARLPEKLLERIDARAERTGASRNDTLIALLEDGFTNKEDVERELREELRRRLEGLI